MNTISTGPIPNLNSKKSIWMRNSIQGLSTLLHPRSSRLSGLRAKDFQDVPIDRVFRDRLLIQLGVCPRFNILWDQGAY